MEILVSASPTAPARLSHSGGSVRRGRVVSGRHKVRWDASNVASGVYIYRAETDHGVVAKKLVLLK